MSWVRIDDQMAFHAKVVAAGNEAVGAWIRILALACAQLSDGHVTQAVALTIAKQKVLEVLVKVRLLDRTDGGYVVHDFHDWNPPASEVKAKREAERIRKESARKGPSKTTPTVRAVRELSARTNDAVRDLSGGCPDTLSRPSPLPSSDPPEAPQDTDTDRAPDEPAESPSETRLKTDTFGDHEIGDAWAQGVTVGAAATMAPPSRGELRELVALAAAHGPSRTGMHGSRDVAVWARERGRAFGETHRDVVRNVWKFRDWVNSGGAKPGIAKRFEIPSAPAIEKYVAPKPGFNSQGERVDYDVPPPATFGRKAT